ncbi:SAM-dependent methyltransferase [Spirillospora sp. NPDC050679]
MAVPERLTWAVATLDIAPADHLLEIGCGRGAAVELACARLTEGTITALDRSPAMAAAAERRNAAHIAAGRAHVRTTSLEEAALPPASFDKVFAVNVNLFWTRSPHRELALIREALKPDGSLHLFYEPPTSVEALAEKVTTSLTANGFRTKTTIPEHERPLLHVTGRPDRL